MPVVKAHLPDTAEIRERLTKPVDLLVVCYCAAWCDTCTLYRDRFDGLAAQHPEHAFVWIDIEDHPELLGEEDVENFPTLAIERQGTVLFFGTMLPHIQQLERLMLTLATDPAAPGVQTTLPELQTALKTQRQT